MTYRKYAYILQYSLDIIRSMCKNHLRLLTIDISKKLFQLKSHLSSRCELVQFNPALDENRYNST